jgi:hypothetical protein
MEQYLQTVRLAELEIKRLLVLKLEAAAGVVEADLF